MNGRVLTGVLLAGLTISGAAFATGAPSSSPPAQQTPPQQAAQQAVPPKTTVGAPNPYGAQIREAAIDLDKALSPKEEDALAHLLTGFGETRAVNLARQHVKAATDKCESDNPLMADEIRKHFAAWDAQIGPAIDINEKAMDVAVNKGVFKNPAPITAYLNLIDKSARYADDQQEKMAAYQPLTTAEGCKNLMDSMSRTQETLVKILHDIEWPVADRITPGTQAHPAMTPVPREGNNP
jgi:hypothetical protein